MHEWDPRPKYQTFVQDIYTHQKHFFPNPISPLYQSDLFIKHNILNTLMQHLRTKYNLNFYIWRAERQDDEILHFHILGDREIPYAEINTYWNNLIRRFGYIDKYKENQIEFHKNGFKFRPEYACSVNPKTGKKQKIWSYEAQRKAYIRGVQTDWQNPISTTDIHPIRAIRNTKAYLAKYISKPADVTKKVQAIASEIAKTRGLAHLWFISQALSHLKSAILDISDVTVELFKKIFKEMEPKIYFSDWCQIFKFSIKDIIAKNFTPLITALQIFISDIRSKFFPCKNNLFSTLGIPLNLFP
jgi:hypothetical protein